MAGRCQRCVTLISRIFSAMPFRRHGVLPALAIAILLTACAGRTRPQASPLQPSSDSIARLEAQYHANSDSAHMRFTDADVHFITGMIGHHAQALVMSALVPDRTTNGSVRTLASRIINAQRDEIALMQQWLRERGQPVPEPDPRGMAMAGMDHPMLMPGMLTPDQLQQLGAARGAAFDRLFLTFMIQHHTGAVTMVDSLVASPASAQEETVFRLASGVRVDQTTEINRMRLMLQALP